MNVEKIAAFGKALRNYRDGYGGSRYESDLVEAFRAIRFEVEDIPGRVNRFVDAVENVSVMIGVGAWGTYAHEYALKTAALEIANWADPPRKEVSDTDVTGLIADHTRAAE